LLEKIKDIAFKYPAWGYRMIWAGLRKQGTRVNHKKVYRLSCSVNLQKPTVVSGKKPYRLTQPFEADLLPDRISGGRPIEIFMCWISLHAEEWSY